MGSGYSVVSQPSDANSVAGRATISTMIIAQYSPPNSDVIMSWASELPYFSSTAPTGNTTPTGTATPAPYGSVTQALAQPIVGMASTPDGKGYWLVASDGGIFTFGDATFYGSAANNGITATGIIASADGKGYSIVSSTGEQFAFGDSTTESPAVANQSLVGIASSASGAFYGVTSSGSVVVG